ncbi:glycosyltransferase [Pedobacter sp. HMF7647]|uniref:Glycosyltransferase n=1 Tax=Hufsiella arboris TaxID=2695275 RepID=A0A7K1YB55_9SPHI|nr:glycosyltransferase [Hufsiella arboris]MXV51660.1 glycosyltransferase [Hufsiella arboris]
MLNIKHNVSVLTVTYGNRWLFLEQVINRLLSFPQVSKIVIVNNASEYDVEMKVNELAHDRAVVLNNAENLGSAGGYRQAIEYAHRSTGNEFLWLLDDDNRPEENVLEKLLLQWRNIQTADNKKALFCLRDDRAAHLKIAAGETPYRYYLVPNNFLGFSVSSIAKNQLYKLRDKFDSQLPFKERVSIPYVPYGGLFFHKSMVDLIGLPDERFFLYVDDSEYSYRITQSDGTIWLIPSCKVDDIDKSQGIGYKKQLFHSQLLDQWSFRTYYAIRNRLYFYQSVAVKNKTIFNINKGLYLFYLKIISLLSGKSAEYKKLLTAVDDGINGNLGKATPNKF